MITNWTLIDFLHNLYRTSINNTNNTHADV